MIPRVRRLLSLVFLAVLAATASAQEPHFGAMRSDRGTENRLCDLVSVHLKLRLDERARTFEGSVTNRLVPLREGLTELWFDAVELEIVGVSVAGELAVHELDGRKLSITAPRELRLGRPYDVSIAYRGEAPDRGLYFIRPTEDDPEVAFEIWSQGQSENNRYWIPTWDYPTDRASFVGEFTVRDGLTVVSNGALVETRRPADGWTTWHYALDFPFPTYLISICVGDYERYVDDFRGIPVEYYVQRGVGEETARRSFGSTPDMLAFFSDSIGIRYPYPKYAQTAVQRFIVGGMENISATTQTDRTLHDEREHLDRDSDGLVAHELAHQWWGDYLTTRTWRHLWLNEGFATYFEALYTGHARGTDEFRLEMRDNQRSAIGRDRPGRTAPLVESFFNRRESGGGGNNVYVKGSSVLHMIRTLLGDELWWRAIRHYGTKHAGQLVETQDFEVAIEEATGHNLHWLFEQYVYLPGHPEIEVTQAYDQGAKEVVLAVKQVQDTSGMVPVFRYPVPIEVTWDGGRECQDVWITEAEQEVRLACPAPPRMVRFDKGSAMLKVLRFEKGAEELAYQARNDDDVVGRMRAVEQIAGAGDETLARETLLAVLASEDHPALREEAASRLGGLRGAGVVAALRTGLRDGAPRVRRACARVLGRIEPPPGDERDGCVADLIAVLPGEPSYATQEAIVGSLGSLGGPQALAALREAEGYASPDGRVARAALRARLTLGDEGAVAAVLALAERGPSNGERVRGIELLGELDGELEGARRERVAEILLTAAQDGSGDLARAAVSSLGRLEMAEGLAVLRELAEREGGRGRSGRWFRMNVQRAIERIEGARDRAAEKERAQRMAGLTDVDEVEEKLRELQREVEALTGRLEELKEEEGQAGPVSGSDG